MTQTSAHVRKNVEWFLRRNRYYIITARTQKRVYHTPTEPAGDRVLYAKYIADLILSYFFTLLLIIIFVPVRKSEQIQFKQSIFVNCSLIKGKGQGQA